MPSSKTRNAELAARVHDVLGSRLGQPYGLAELHRFERWARRFGYSTAPDVAVAGYLMAVLTDEGSPQRMRDAALAIQCSRPVDPQYLAATLLWADDFTEVVERKLV
jgi:hypothetical protein